MKKASILFSLVFISLLNNECKSISYNSVNTPSDKTGSVDSYVTSSDKSKLFFHAVLTFNSKDYIDTGHTIYLHPLVRYQQIDGFGAAITGSSCYNLLKMSGSDRSKLLSETFDTVNGAGYSYIRISIGCSDFSMDEYTCCDTPGIEHFRIHDLDKRDLIPVLKEILTINSKVKILASPWTCPRWMKVNNLIELKPQNSWTSGQLNPKYYQDYALYFVRFVQEMGKYGIPIQAITIQNEPLNRGNSSSLYMTWQEQAEFIKTALGPKFDSAGIKAKIVIFDHNYNYDNIVDQEGYPLKIYQIPEAARYVDGAAYHAYGGDKSELLKVHNAASSKNLYFTEMSIGTWNYTFDGDLIWSMRELGIGTLNNYCKSVIVWNFLLDENGAPNRPGGCTTCYGAVEISSKDYSTLDRKSHFYVIAHLSKVISQAATRIGVSGYKPDGLSLVAVVNPDGTFGTVLLNENNSTLNITIDVGIHSFSYTLPSRSITSFRW
jgi:glucosylceramidase